jgi:GNAT superfamily N-acetyltransferase
MLKTNKPTNQYCEIIKATEEDLEELFELAETFWHESNFNREGITLRPDHWKHTVATHIALPDTAALCAVVAGKIVGYVLVYYQADFTEERIGEMFQFYVSPEWRGTNIPRELVAAAMKQYEEWGCVRAYCEASPGLSFRDHLALFKNLWGKFGYQEVGITLMKEFK